MPSNNTFRIRAFGLSERELRVLQTICLVSRSRPRTYELVSAGAFGTADIAVINGDDGEAVAAWQAFHSGNARSPAVLVANEPVPEWRGHQIGRPIMSTRLLTILDHLEVASALKTFNRSAAARISRSGGPRRTSPD